jgi:hypothetical protein
MTTDTRTGGFGVLCTVCLAGVKKKSVAKESLVKTKESDVSCDYSEKLSVWFSETVIITMLKSVARKRLVKIEDFYVSCDHSDNWSVWYRETVIITV